MEAWDDSVSSEPSLAGSSELGFDDLQTSVSQLKHKRIPQFLTPFFPLITVWGSCFSLGSRRGTVLLLRRLLLTHSHSLTLTHDSQSLTTPTHSQLPLTHNFHSLTTPTHSQLPLTHNSHSLTTPAHSQLPLTHNSHSLTTPVHSQLPLTHNSHSLTTPTHSQLPLTHTHSHSLSLTLTHSFIDSLTHSFTRQAQYRKLPGCLLRPRRSTQSLLE